MVQFATANTYADLIGAGIPTDLTIYNVLSDETKAGVNTSYLYYPAGTIIYIGVINNLSLTTSSNTGFQI